MFFKRELIVIIAALISIFSFSTFADELPNKVTCVTEIPTTSHIIEKEDDTTLSVRVIHHNGTQFVPVYRGVVTPNDIDLIRSRGEFFAKMGEQFDLEIPLKTCKAYGEYDFSCYVRTKKKIGGVDVNGYSLWVSTTTNRAFGQTFKAINITMGFLVNNRYHDMDAQFNPRDCHIE